MHKYFYKSMQYEWVSGVSFLTYTMDSYSLNTTINLCIFLYNVFLCDSCYIYTLWYLLIWMSSCVRTVINLLIRRAEYGKFVCRWGQKQNAKKDICIIRCFIICSLWSGIWEAKATEMRWLAMDSTLEYCELCKEFQLENLRKALNRLSGCDIHKNLQSSLIWVLLYKLINIFYYIPLTLKLFPHSA